MLSIRRSSRRHFVIFIGVLCMGLASGCSRSKPTELKGLSPVTGKILFKGQPATGATVTLVPSPLPGPAADSAKRPPALIATVDPHGHFEVMTVIPAGTAKGAAPGTYTAAVSWSKPKNPNDRDSDMGPELLPAKYQSYELSGLVAEVKPGKNELTAWELEAK